MFSDRFLLFIPFLKFEKSLTLIHGNNRFEKKVKKSNDYPFDFKKRIEIINFKIFTERENLKKWQEITI